MASSPLLVANEAAGRCDLRMSSIFQLVLGTSPCPINVMFFSPFFFFFFFLCVQVCVTLSSYISVYTGGPQRC